VYRQQFFPGGGVGAASDQVGLDLLHRLKVAIPLDIQEGCHAYWLLILSGLDDRAHDALQGAVPCLEVRCKSCICANRSRSITYICSEEQDTVDAVKTQTTV
jgi:hypothetical protein